MPKEGRPALKNLKRAGKIWWVEINGSWVKCIPYNINIENPVNPGTQGDEGMNKEQFEKIMNRFDSLESKVDANTKSINEVKDDLNNIVKKNNLKR